MAPTKHLLLFLLNIFTNINEIKTDEDMHYNSPETSVYDSK